MTSSKIQANNVQINSETTTGMGYKVEAKSSSKSAKEKAPLSPRASRSLKLRDKGNALISERPIDQSHTDQHSGIVQKNASDGHSVRPTLSGNYQHQRAERKATEAEELVKYMSSLPCYLQRTGQGNNVQEKALNFGVLDWGRLEKWRASQRPEPTGSNVHSSSTSNASSSFSIFGSSSLSGRNDCNTNPLGQRQSTSLKSRLKSSAKEDHSQVLDGKPSRDNATSHDPKNIPLKSDQAISKDDLGFKLKKDKRKDSDSKDFSGNTCQPPEMGPFLSNSKDFGCVVRSKGKTNARNGESKSRAEQHQELGFHHSEGTKGHLQERSPGDPHSFECTSSYLGRPTVVNRSSFSEEFNFQLAGHSPAVPHSCPLPCNSQTSKWQDLDICSPVDVPSTKVSSEKTPTIQSNDRPTEQNKSTVKPVKLIPVEPSDGLGSKEAQPCTASRRDPSPSKQSNAGFHKSRSVSSKEVLAARQLNSTSSTAKSGSARPCASACSDSSHIDKANANSRSRHSPLRRILDPLLKVKAFNRRSHFEDSPSDSLGHHVDKSSCAHEPPLQEVSTLKRNLNFSSCEPTNTHGSLPDEKQMPLTAHARLHLATRNELPVFRLTFNNSDVLTATMRKVCIAGKDDFDCIYTFYSIREVKKKSGRWISQGSNSKRPGYVSNIVGQMKVSCTQCPKHTDVDSKDHLAMREFVLFDAEARQANHETLGFLPSRELAAIVINVPKERMGIFKIDGQESGNESNSSMAGQGECVAQDRLSCYPEEDSQIGSNVECGGFSSIVVILPNGVHALPATDGVPSSLISRWKSGGSCDCGGWDVGCMLTILTNQDPQNLSSSQACSTSEDPRQLDLFVQGGAQENKHVFSLAALKEGWYKVDFNASISLLQAFSICIAIFHGRRPVNLSEVCKKLGAKTSLEHTPTGDRIKASTRTQREASATYVIYPPHSPVGRV
ncbi:uncharacterized protein LOC143879992 [Tasmannia lanceolata]|uniref:uncharacterized protein LOC143879992 n=1 Tax=Tasmannia lanceolata TaxID=3420 RepID=UPI004063F3D7